jgi:hypothetical protein
MFLFLLSEYILQQLSVKGCVNIHVFTHMIDSRLGERTFFSRYFVFRITNEKVR